jgi:hypothetical protein
MFAKRLVRDAQISIDNILIAANIIGSAITDFFAVV